MDPLERFCFIFFLLVGLTTACALIRFAFDWWLNQCREDAAEQARREYVDEAAETVDEEESDLTWEREEM